MILIRSLTDGFNLLSGSMYTQIALVVAHLTYRYYNKEQEIFMVNSTFWSERDQEASMLEWILLGVHVLLIPYKFYWNQLKGVANFPVMPFVIFSLMGLVAWLNILRGVENPVDFKDADPD